MFHCHTFRVFSRSSSTLRFVSERSLPLIVFRNSTNIKSWHWAHLHQFRDWNIYRNHPPESVHPDWQKYLYGVHWYHFAILFAITSQLCRFILWDYPVWQLTMWSPTVVERNFLNSGINLEFDVLIGRNWLIAIDT